MSEATTANDSGVAVKCLGWVERGISLEVELDELDFDAAEAKAEDQVDEKLEELGINPDVVSVTFDEFEEAADGDRDE